MLNKTVIFSVLISFLMINNTPVAYAGGAAMCVAKVKDSQNYEYDAKYFLRYGTGATAHNAVRAAREDHGAEYSGIPNCRDSRSYGDSGSWVVISNGSRDRNRFAIGFGNNYNQALDDAFEEMGRRDWNWVKSRHGYEVQDSGDY